MSDINPDLASEWWGEPWPDKYRELRPHQIDAVESILDLYEDGCDVVFVNAPTGSGKSAIAEATRRMLNVRKTLYVCTTKSLQDQFCGDFTYAKLLKGRSNYPTLDNPELFKDRFQPITAAECTKKKVQLPACGSCTTVTEESVLHCNLCHPWIQCPYEMAKREAMSAPLAVTNTSYFLTEANNVGGLAGRDLIIVDECDVTESILRGQIEVYISERARKKYKLGFPDKKTKDDTWLDWVRSEAIPIIGRAVQAVADQRDREQIKEYKYLTGLHDRLGQLVHELERHNIVYDGYKNDSIHFKPIRVNRLARDFMWKHGKQWLLMSATIVDPQELVDSLGIEEAGLKWDVVDVPSTFDKANRPIILRSLANMIEKEKETEWPKMAEGVEKVLARHPGERVLIHTVSYKLAQYLFDKLRYSDRPVFVYSSASERDNVLSMYREQEGSVLLAPSMDRGIDLPYDDCRVVIVCKMPYLSLGDKMVNARMYQQGGQLWYSVQTVRTLIQMTGRGVRSATDTCTTYILDAQFVNNIWKKNKSLLPKYWTDALDWTGGGL